MREELPSLKRSALALPLQLRFQFPNPGLCGHAGFLLDVGAGLCGNAGLPLVVSSFPFLLEGGDVLPGLRVVPDQQPVAPLDGEWVFLFLAYAMSPSVCSRGFFLLSSWSVLSLGSGSLASTMVVPSSSGAII